MVSIEPASPVRSLSSRRCWWTRPRSTIRAGATSPSRSTTGASPSLSETTSTATPHRAPTPSTARPSPFTSPREETPARPSPPTGACIGTCSPSSATPPLVISRRRISSSRGVGLAERDLGQEPRPSARRALDPQPSLQRLDPIGQAAQTRATRRVGAANPVVPYFHGHQACPALDADTGVRRLGVLGDVGQRLRADVVDGRLHGRLEPLLGDGHLDRYGETPAQLGEGRGQPGLGQRPGVHATGELGHGSACRLQLPLNVGDERPAVGKQLGDVGQPPLGTLTELAF